MSLLSRGLGLKFARQPRGADPQPEAGPHQRHPVHLGLAALLAFAVFVGTGAEPAAALVTIGQNTDVYLYDVEVSQGFAYAAAGVDGMQIFDVSDGDPVRSGGVDGSLSVGIALHRGFAYVAEQSRGVAVIDVSDPTRPREVAILTSSFATGVAVSDDHAYVADSQEGLRIFDVSNPASPKFIGATETGFRSQALAVSGTLVVIAARFDGLRLVDVSDPSAPVEVAAITGIGETRAVAVRGGLAYVAIGDKFRVVDVSDPANPSFLGSLQTGYARDVALADDLAYLTLGSSGAVTIEIGDPEQLDFAGVLDTPGDARGLAIERGIGYLADGTGGLRVVDLRYPGTPSEIGGHWTRANVLSVSDRIAYFAETIDFGAIDISNPETPALLGSRRLSSIFDIELSNGLAYVAAWTRGVYVVDLSDPNLLEIVGGFHEANIRDVALDGSFLYAVEGTEGLVVFDISNPTAPAPVARHPLDSPLRVEVEREMAYVAGGYSGLHIVDVSMPSEPRRLATLDLIGWVDSVEVVGDLAYVGGSALFVVDVSRPASPEIIGIGPPGEIRDREDNLLYVVSSGSVRVVDISVAEAPREIGGYRVPGGSLGIDEIDVADGIAYVHASGFRVVDLGPEYAPLLEPEIDIEPRIAETEIPWRPTVEVAILGSETFDVAEVDRAELTFGPNQAAPIAPVGGGTTRDVDSDGFADLLSRYRLRETGIALGEQEACIGERLAGGRRFEGCAPVAIRLHCGLGFELTVPLVALALARRRRRSRDTGELIRAEVDR